MSKSQTFDEEMTTHRGSRTADALSNSDLTHLVAGQTPLLLERGTFSGISPSVGQSASTFRNVIITDLDTMIENTVAAIKAHASSLVVARSPTNNLQTSRKFQAISQNYLESPLRSGSKFSSQVDSIHPWT
jgi:hypothetical protein